MNELMPVCYWAHKKAASQCQHINSCMFCKYVLHTACIYSIALWVGKIMSHARAGWVLEVESGVTAFDQKGYGF